jgi:hypothetical protein
MPVLYLFALLVGACSDYKLSSENDVVDGEEPDILVEPTAIDAAFCTRTEQPLTVSNIGLATLTVSAVALEGEGWEAEIAEESFSLEPGEARAFTLVGTGGAGSFRVESDDPDSPVVRVPLEGALDGPPEASIVAPLAGEILDVGGAVSLEGEVSDAEDAADTLEITWTSDVDGVLSTAPADAAGRATASWPYAGRSEGDHLLTLTAVDACGNSATDSVSLCQQAGYTSEELDLDGWHFEGAAFWDGDNDRLELTDTSTNVVGTAFAIDEVVSGADVNIRFNFYIGDGTGADGISLTALDTERMTTFLGGTGCGIGYGGDADCTAGPALPGWSIEVDTYFNDGQDPTEDDHLMLTFDGDVDDPEVWVALPEMEDNGWHAMEVEVAAPRVTVSIDGVIYIDEDIAADDGAVGFEFPAYVGFTAGTGGATNNHWIESLEVTQYACE